MRRTGHREGDEVGTGQALHFQQEIPIDTTIPVQEVNVMATRRQCRHQVRDVAPDAGGEGFRYHRDPHGLPVRRCLPLGFRRGVSVPGLIPLDCFRFRRDTRLLTKN
jgi:hypothetical protein